MDRSFPRRLGAVGTVVVAAMGVAGCGGGLPVSAAPTATAAPPASGGSSATTAPPSGGTTRPAGPPSTTTAPPTPTPAPPITRPPLTHATDGTALLRTALADAAAERWMRTLSTSPAPVAGEATTTSATVDGPGAGTQQITVGSVSGSIRVLGARTYINGSPEALVDLFDVPEGVASELGDRWVVLRPDDREYASVTVGVTITSFLQEIAFTGAVTAGTSTLDGAAVRVVEGRLAPSVGTGSGVLYLTGGTRPRPLEWVQAASTGTTRTAFSGWGRATTVTAPPGAVTLPASAGTTGPVAVIRPT